MNEPAVSVLMPVWNGCAGPKEPWFRKSIESILDQTLPDFELVIVDDGSSDRTPQVMQEYRKRDDRIRLFRLEKNQGIVSALNYGLGKCRAPLVARQDSDDMSTVTRLELQKAFLDARPETAMCGTGMYVINGEGKLVMEINDRPCSYPAVREALKTCCVFVHGSVMFRKAVMDKIGGYSPDPRFQHAEDFEAWVRMAKDHVVENIPGKIFYFHRNHGGKIGEVHRQQQEKATYLIMELARKALN